MFRKLGIMWRSFLIKYIRNERYKGWITSNTIYRIYFEEQIPMLQRRLVKDKFDYNIINPHVYAKSHMQRNTIKWYKNNKEYTRIFEDMND